MTKAPKGSRTCRRCRQVFPSDRVYTSGHCTTCEPLRRKEYLDAHPEKRAAASASSAAYLKEHRGRYTAREREGRRQERAERAAALHARGLYTVREAAGLLGRSYETMRHQVAAGLLAVVREGRRVSVHEDAIERYRAEHLRALARDRRDDGGPSP